MKTVLLTTPLLVFAFSSSGVACDEVTWLRGKTPVVVCYDKNIDGFISASCLTKTPCWAETAALRANDLRLPASEAETYIPRGPEVCRILGGVYETLKSKAGHEASFCRGTDKSVLDINVLNQVADLDQ